MHDHMTVPVEWKTASGSSSTGELEGYASVFGNVDQGGDVVLPGAFRKTLADWSRSSQPLPLIADHDLTTKGVIGSVRQAREDGTGLWIRAGFSSVPEAQAVRTKMIEGHLKGMSFTYETVRHRMGQVAGKSARFLEELKLFEATVTPFPMNTLALASAKDAMPAASINDLPDSDFAYIEPGGKKDGEGKTVPRSLRHFPIHDEAHVRNALARAPQSPFGPKAMPKIRAAAMRMGIHMAESASLNFAQFSDLAVKAAVSLHEMFAAYLDDAAVLSDEQDTAGAAASTPDGAAGTAEDKSAYALQFVTAPPPEPPDGALATLTPLEVARTSADLDRVEAQINQKLGRTTQ